MTKQREIEQMFLKQGMSKFSSDLDTHYLELFQYGFEIKSVRDLNKNILKDIIVDEFFFFAKVLLFNIETMKITLNIVGESDYEYWEANYEEFEYQLKWLKIIKRAAEPILEKEYLKLKPGMNQDIIREYEEKLKGFKFILK